MHRHVTIATSNIMYSDSKSLRDTPNYQIPHFIFVFVAQNLLVNTRDS